MHHSESRDRRRSAIRRLVHTSAAAALVLGAAAPLAAQTLAPQPDVVRQQARANRANWTLAERFNPATLRPILYTTSVQPHWLGKSDSLWYNWRDGKGSHFYLVLPDSRAKRDLFDRERLAAQLAELSHRPVDPNNLSFQTITFTKDHKAFRFTADSVRYEWSLGTGTLKSLGKPSKTPATDEEREQGRGGQGGGQFGAQGAEFRAYSPDSTAFAFARAHNLFVVEVNKADTLKSDTLQVTTDGAMDYSFGFRDTSENRRQLDALGQGAGGQNNTDDDNDNSKDQRVRPRVVWSPDSKSLAVVRQDQRKVKELYLVNVLAQPRPVLVHYRYAMPGEQNVPQNELWVFRRGDKAAKQLKVARWRDQRLMDLHFPVSGDKLRLVRQDRPQRAVELVEVDVASGAVKTLIAESVENASIDPEPVRYLKKGGDLVWWSERSGWGQLYAYDFNGGTKPKYALTSGAWHVDGIEGLDSTRGVLWFTGMGRESGENPYYQHLYRVASNGNGGASGVELLDAGNFTHNESLSPTRRYFVDSYSRVDAPTKNVLRDATTGRVVMELGDADVSKLQQMGWRAPEQFVVKAADGVTDIYGNIFKPFDFDSTRKYALVANVYPGPQTESVTLPFSPSNVPQYLAQLGVVVIQIGNRGGSPKRSAAYHRYGYGNAREYALADEKSGIEQLAAMHHYIDLDRVGIYGHSGGGFLTASAMLTPPYNEFYKAGWSESGNHDNNIYNQNWSEWNYGLKPVRPDSGARSRGNLRAGAGRGARTGASPDALPNDGTADDSLVGSAIASGALALSDTGTVVTDTTTSQYDSTRYEIHVPTTEELAANLRGNLALMTGDMDNNVHPGNTIRLANALMKANKRFDFYIVPGQPHGYRTSVNYTNHMMLEFFAEHLLGDYYRTDASMR